MIPENQVGINYDGTPPAITFPTVVDNSPQLSKTFRVKNTGIADVMVDWKLFDDHDREDMREWDMFDISIVKNSTFDSNNMTYKLNFAMIEPPESTESPYEIEPKVCVISSKSTATFTVKFNSHLDVGHFPSVMLAHPKIAEQNIDPDDDELISAKSRPLGIVALWLNATTCEPILMVDKLQRLDLDF